MSQAKIAGIVLVGFFALFALLGVVVPEVLGGPGSLLSVSLGGVGQMGSVVRGIVGVGILLGLVLVVLKMR